MGALPEVILIEFNELCPAFLREFMDDGLLPNFRKLYRSSRIFTTDAGEEERYLEPWIQWVTVHSGMTRSEHNVFHLGEGRDLKERCIAQLLSDAGIPVGVFSSMNTNYRELNGYVIPDPWDTEGSPSPRWLEPFYRTVANQVQESSKEDAFTKKDMARFGWFMLRNGLTFSSIRAIMGQLLDERRDPGTSWRRASLLEHVQYDLFRRLNRRFGVRFATFFCNSTAHYQHYFWRNMEPERFQMQPPSKDHSTLRDAIQYGYQSMDRIVGRFLDDYPDSAILLSTGLSQKAWDTTKCTFRPRSFKKLLEFAGIPHESVEVRPVMAEQFHVRCSSEEDARRAAEGLKGLITDHSPIMAVELNGDSVFAGCRATDATFLDSAVVRNGNSVEKSFVDLFYMVHSVRSGRHHPDGVLWIRDGKNGKHEINEEKVPLTVIAPAILNYFGVELPSHISAEPAAGFSGLAARQAV